MAMSVQQQLEATRYGYDEESVWLRFLLDAFTGGGGFQGRVRQAPAGFWGAIADAYRVYATLSKAGATEGESYLDKYNREDQEKFDRRVKVSHYLNYVKPTTNLKISYLVRKPHKRNNVPDALAEWIARTGYDKAFRRRALVAAVLGWFPMLVDMPQRPENARTAAEAGRLDPYVVLSLPCHLRDYELDDQGEFIWAKMATRFTRKETWDAEPVEVTRYTVWTRTDYTIFEVEGTQNTPSAPIRGTHPFKRVPIISWRTDTSVEDHVRADSINAEVAPECRRLFNLLSELDEHLRSQVFALLVYPTSSPTPTEKLDVGTENGLQVSGEQKNLPFYLAPPASVAATIEARIVATIVEIYRLARVEYDRASGTESSAQSKQQNFEQTNLAIVDLATSLAQADRETLIVVGRGLNIEEAKLQEIECVAHESYASEDLSIELEQAITALTIRELGRQVRVELLLRLAQQLLPHLAPDTRKVIEQEIADAVARAEQEAEAAKAEEDEEKPGDDGPGDGGGGEEDDDKVPEAAE